MYIFLMKDRDFDADDIENVSSQSIKRAHSSLCKYLFAPVVPNSMDLHS